MRERLNYLFCAVVFFALLHHLHHVVVAVVENKDCEMAHDMSTDSHRCCRDDTHGFSYYSICMMTLSVIVKTKNMLAFKLIV